MNRRLCFIGALLLAVSCGGGDVAPSLWAAEGLVTPDAEDGLATVDAAGEAVVGDDVVHDTVPAELPPDALIVDDACVRQCTGLQCGPDGCGGQCGGCQAGATCAAGQCVCTPGVGQVCCGSAVCAVDSCGSVGAQLEACQYACNVDHCVGCTPACAGKACGDDGCGGQCGPCQGGATCVADQCVCTPKDHLACCGGNVCWFDSCGAQGDQAEACQYGCYPDHCAFCTPACTGKTCGFDNCGGVCGTCTGQDVCVQGNCKCAPACQGKECGSNGCGGSCGTCPTGAACSANGKCGCAPKCAGKTCGGDGCGGSCGTCPTGQNCSIATGSCVGCTPYCTGKVCGDNGCGGTCGTCKAGDSCTAGQCISPNPCNGLPSSWGPVGVTATMSTPGNAQIISSTCFDYTGDGQGDNGLSQLVTLGAQFGFDINQLIQQGIASGTMSIVFEFQGVTDFVNTPSFPLNGLRGQPQSGGSTSYLLDKASYDGNCNPLIAFKNAVIKAKGLSAGPGYFIMILPLQGLTMTLALENARMSGNVTSGSANGVNLSNGVIGGLLTQQALDDAMAGLQSQCNGPNAPGFCQYLSYLPMILTMNVDTNGDGTADAMAVCFQVTLKAGKVVGYL